MIPILLNVLFQKNMVLTNPTLQCQKIISTVLSVGLFSQVQTLDVFRCCFQHRNLVSTAQVTKFVSLLNLWLHFYFSDSKVILFVESWNLCCFLQFQTMATDTLNPHLKRKFDETCALRGCGTRFIVGDRIPIKNLEEFIGKNLPDGAAEATFKPGYDAYVRHGHNLHVCRKNNKQAWHAKIFKSVRESNDLLVAATSTSTSSANDVPAAAAQQPHLPNESIPLSTQTRAMRRADVQAAPSEAAAAAAAASANADARSDSDLPLTAGASLPTASASSSSNTTGRPRRRPKEDPSSAQAKISELLFTMRINSELNHSALGSFECHLSPNDVYILSNLLSINDFESLLKYAETAKAQAAASSPGSSSSSFSSTSDNPHPQHSGSDGLF